MAVLENFVYVPDKQFIFGYVPKVACTNWKCILRYISGQKDYLNSALAHDRKRSGLVYLSDRSDSWELLSDPNISVYTFVRNPYSRLLSAYMNKVEPYVTGNADADEDGFWAMVFREMQAEVTGTFGLESVTFYGFLRWLSGSESQWVANEHWVSQYEILSPDKIDFDFVGRMECIQRDAQKALERIGCEIGFPSREDVRFPATNAEKMMDMYYSATTRRIVQDLHKEDFEWFGYSF